MDDDRTEMHDLAADQPDRVKQIGKAWRQPAEANQVLPLRPWAGKAGANAD